MMFIVILLALVSTLLGALGALMLKQGASILKFQIKVIIRNYNLWLGFLLYVFASIIFVYALKFGELSMIYPLTSLSYIWVTLLSVVLLKEKVRLKKWIGISLILVGVILLSLK